MGKPFINLTGQKFGRLTILKEAKPRFVISRKKIKFIKRYWHCKCDCGNEKEIRGDCLGREKNPTISCGCVQKESTKISGLKRRLPAGQKPFNDLLCAYKRHAKEKKRIFFLSKEKFFKLTQDKCYYCGTEPNQIFKDNRYPDNIFIYNGVDRVDSSQGYTEENSVTCCRDCNYAKNDLPQDKFLDLVRKIFHYRINETSKHRKN